MSVDETEEFLQPELYDINQLLALPPPEWLMTGLLPQGLSILYGEPENGKSFVALHWAACIAMGKPWLEKFPVKRGPVIYIAAEGGRGIKKRVIALMNHFGVRDIPGLYFLLEPIHMRDPEVVDWFIDLLNARDIWPELLVIDTLSQCFIGGKENAQEDMTMFVGEVNRIGRARQMSRLVVHHTNKGGQEERGSNTLRAAADAMFFIRAAREKAGAQLISHLKLDTTKQKDNERAEPVYLKPVERIKTSLVFEELKDPPQSAKERVEGLPAPMRKADMLTLLGSHPDGLTFSEWRLASQVPRRTFARRVSQLMRDGEIYKDDESHRYFVYPSGVDIAELEREED